MVEEPLKNVTAEEVVLVWAWKEVVVVVRNRNYKVVMMTESAEVKVRVL